MPLAPADAPPLDNAVQTHFADGVARMAAGDKAGAVAAFHDALALAPGLMEAHLNLGLLFADSDAAVSEMHYRAAIDAAPLRSDGHIHLGALLAARKRFAEAEHSYRLALAIEPASAAALSNLGVLLACTGRQAQARACYHAAIAAAPGHRSAHFNLAYLLLRDGDYAAGWRAFEYRAWYAGFAGYFRFPRWQGEALAGKALLIAIEAGHGDMIQFCRYASLLGQHGATRVGIVCHSGLARLFASLAGVDAVYDVAHAVPQDGWDYWAPPLSLPFQLGTTVASIPAALPYLAATPADRARLAVCTGPQRPGLRVGLVWQGNPDFENDADRSIGVLATLAPLLAVAGARFFSLQKGAGELALLNAGDRPAGLTDLAPHIADFADTAALIDGLDLVITVDTAVAHLAGALNKTCWVLLPAFKPDWRWLSGRADTPWYPGALRLFRQQRAGDWPAVIAGVADALAQHIAR